MQRHLIRPFLIGAAAAGLLLAGNPITEVSMAANAGESGSAKDKGTSASVRSSASVSASSSASGGKGACSARSSASAVARGPDGIRTDHDEKHVRSQDGSCSVSSKARATAGGGAKPESEATVETGGRERE